MRKALAPAGAGAFLFEALLYFSAGGSDLM